MKRKPAAVISKKLVLWAVMAVACHSTRAQKGYWQQEVHYRINVTLNDLNHTLKGEETIDYINQSPDTLHFIWFHLWPNAYKGNTTAFYRQLVKLNNHPAKLIAGESIGYIDSLDFTVNGQTAIVETQPEDIDIIKIMLKDDLLPGQHITLATPFFVKIPVYTSRFGYSNGMFMITQWYPKPAVYDRKGWHQMPYLDQGEFYSEFGSFTVNITVPSDYVVAATGTLRSTDELIKYKTVGAVNYKMYNLHADSKEKALTYTAAGMSSSKVLEYYGKDIHDFAWFADKNFIIQYDTILMKSGKPTDVFSFKQPDDQGEWNSSIGFIKDAIKNYSNWIGEYAYPVVNAVEGPVNASSGGMEYPMITLITSPGADKENLDAVIAHEVGHNWFYGALGTNERDHAWMDEGINTYYEFRYEAEKYRANLLLGDRLPANVKQMPSGKFLQFVYNSIAGYNGPAPIDLPSEEFNSNGSYYNTVYNKAALWMYMLESKIGKSVFDKSMQAFYKQWQFRHPYPEDMKTSFQKTSGKELDDIFNLLAKKGLFN